MLNKYVEFSKGEIDYAALVDDAILNLKPVTDENPYSGMSLWNMKEVSNKILGNTFLKLKDNGEFIAFQPLNFPPVFIYYCRKMKAWNEPIYIRAFRLKF